MRNSAQDPPTCPLRKPCGWCKQPFGRRTKLNRGKLILISMAQWNETECCSYSCSRKLVTARKQAAKAQHEEQEVSAIDNFIFGRHLA